MSKAADQIQNINIALRWGIVSAGLISHDFVASLSTLEPGSHEVLAVAARDLERAKSFAKTFQIRNAYQGYDQLAADPDIEIVYIGALNPQHFEITKLMLENGKHVMCEKPLCMNYKQAKALIDLAKSKKLFLMEAVWSRFFPTYKAIAKEIESGSIGDIVHVYAGSGVQRDDVARMVQKDLGGGTVLDLGVYALQFAQFIMKDYPENLTSTGMLNDDGVDIATNAILQYSGGRTAVISTHCKTQFSNEAYIYGTKGSIKVHGKFWCPTQITKADGSTIEFPLPKVDYPLNFVKSAGLAYQAVEVKDSIRGGLLEAASMSHAMSLDLAKLQDTIRKQIGVKYSVDD